jgi:hypothetical protein
MNIEKIFEQCANIEPFDEECYKLLNKIMSIVSPMKFDSEFASDEELDRLEAELDRFNRRSQESDTLVRTVTNLEPYKTNRFIFI